MDGTRELLIALTALFATLWLATRWSQRLRRNRGDTRTQTMPDVGEGGDR